MPKKLFTKDNQPSGAAKSRKGKPNRTTEEIRNFIQQVVDHNLDSLPQDLASMSPTNRWLVQDKLIKYFLPALSKNDNTNLNTGDVTIRIIEVKSNKTDADDTIV